MKRIFLSLALLFAMSGFRANNDISLSGNYENLTISLSGTSADPVIVTGNGANIKCLKITGNWVYVSDVVAQWCQTDGVLITGRNVRFENSTVTDNAQVYGGAGWCEGVPAYHGIKATRSPVTIKGNTVYNNCGNGIYSITASIENNSVFNNYITNIYGTIIKSNASQCEFSTKTGIFFIGRAVVYQNYVSGCSKGIVSSGRISGSVLENLVVGDTIRINHRAQGTTVQGNNTSLPIVVLYPSGVTLTDNYLLE